MRSLIAERDTGPDGPPPEPRRPRRDPAPSRIRYRLSRLWLRPWVRKGVRLWLPLGAIATTLVAVFSHPANQARISDLYHETVDGIRSRPEFVLTGMRVSGASEVLRAQVTQTLGLDFPTSSLGLDLETLRQKLEALHAVRSARVTVDAGNRLYVDVVEQQPAIIWRHAGRLVLLDGEGYRLADISHRTERADLPLILGIGADAATPEALRLMRVMTPILDRVRGLVRVGERRWDVVLDRGQRIMLPEAGAVAALERVMALERVEALLERDVVRVDMRDGRRPVLRLTPSAIGDLNNRRLGSEGEET